MGKLKAGAAKVCITLPEELMPYPVPVWFGGGEYTGVQEDVYVRCIALDNGEQRALIICAELGCYQNAETIQRRIEAELGVPFDHVLISATHNHEAPEGKINPDIRGDQGNRQMSESEKRTAELAAKYNQFLEDQTVLAARKSLENLEPARIGYGQGKSYINCNRDELLENGNYGHGLNPERPSDKALAVIRIESLSGRKIAVLINYAVHNNMCFQQKDAEGKGLMVFGDISGQVSKFVEERFEGDGVVALWTNGAAGNQNPYIADSYPRYHADKRVEDGAYHVGYPMWDLCRYVGQRQGIDVIRTMGAITEYTDDLKIGARYEKYTLPGTKVVGFTREMIMDASKIDHSKITNVDTGEVPLGLMLLTLGDIALYGINGEVMCETGMRIKEHSPIRHTMIVSMMGDNPGGKYMVDEWGYQHRTFAYYRNTIKNGEAEKCMLQNLNKMAAELGQGVC